MATHGKWTADPGQNCPEVSDLKTGDLLFPRLPFDDENSVPSTETQLQSTIEYWSGSALKVSDLFKKDGSIEQALYQNKNKIASFNYFPDLTRAVKVGAAGSAYELQSKQALDNRSTQTTAPRRPIESLFSDPTSDRHPINTLHTAGTVFPDPNDPEFIYVLGRVIDITFPDLLKNWLDMSVKDFLSHDISRFLFTALTSTDVRASFFVGHVGMVFVEEGETFVIEANITDYSHYRVAIHPYFIKKEQSITQRAKDKLEAKEFSGSLRGWANVRCAHGEMIWCARPKVADIKNWQTRLVKIAKGYLGRPYGFFDNPHFGDWDRMYCAEYIFRVFADLDPELAKTLNSKQTWADTVNYLKSSGQTDQRKLLEKILKGNPDYFKANPNFFVLPPALLWNGDGMVQRFNPPGGKGAPYAVKI